MRGTLPEIVSSLNVAIPGISTRFNPVAEVPHSNWIFNGVIAFGPHAVAPSPLFPKTLHHPE